MVFMKYSYGHSNKLLMNGVAHADHIMTPNQTNPVEMVIALTWLIIICWRPL